MDIFAQIEYLRFLTYRLLVIVDNRPKIHLKRAKPYWSQSFLFAIPGSFA